MSLAKDSAWTTLFAITNVGSNTISTGSAVDVSTYYEVGIGILFGRTSGTALSVQPKIRLQFTGKNSSPGVNDWVTFATFTPAVGASIGAQAVSGTASAAATSVTLAAGTNFAAGNFVFFLNSTLANSDWSRVQSISSATLTLGEGIVNAQTGSTCYSQAEEYAVDSLSVLGMSKIRVQVDNSGTGQGIVVWARITGTTGL